MKRIIALLAVLSVAACMPKPETKIVDTSCSWVKPIYVNKSDKISAKTANQILAHDDKWQQFCGDKNGG
jgi:hypothetical protein